MIEDLARMILEAQRFKEESWNKIDLAYALCIEDAVQLAGETSGLDTRVDELVDILLSCAWNDAGAWAEKCLKKPRYSLISDVLGPQTDPNIPGFPG